MSVSLIVTNAIDREYNETGDEIDEDEWLELIESDPALILRTEPFTATAPDGAVIWVSVPGGQSELILDKGSTIPFLGLFGGRLSMRYHPDMEMQTNPVRLKVVEISRYFDALITSDAEDDFLEW